MRKPLHQVLKIEEDARIIVISDIHGHLQLFLKLLKKLHYEPLYDYLVILGDFVEKGDETLECIHYLMKLSQYEKCIVLIGNCEWALSAILTTPELAKQISVYLSRVHTNGLIRQLYKKYNHEKQTILNIQKEMREFLRDEIRFMNTRPITLKINNHIFVHAGLDHTSHYKQGTLPKYLEYPMFYKEGHHYKEMVVVGHTPVSNYKRDINNSIIIDKKKRIISIDGGVGVKPVSQLNALIIEYKKNHVSYTTDYVHDYPSYKITHTRESNHLHHKVAYPYYEIDVLNKGEDFSECLYLNERMMIKNEFIHDHYCDDDYTDHFLSIHKGDDISVIKFYDNYAYCLYKEKVGWVRREDIDET